MPFSYFCDEKTFARQLRRLCPPSIPSYAVGFRECAILRAERFACLCRMLKGKKVNHRQME